MREDKSQILVGHGRVGLPLTVYKTAALTVMRMPQTGDAGIEPAQTRSQSPPRFTVTQIAYDLHIVGGYSIASASYCILWSGHLPVRNLLCCTSQAHHAAVISFHPVPFGHWCWWWDLNPQCIFVNDFESFASRQLRHTSRSEGTVPQPYVYIISSSEKKVNYLIFPFFTF